jgi:hypothetical protein
MLDVTYQNSGGIPVATKAGAMDKRNICLGRASNPDLDVRKRQSQTRSIDHMHYRGYGYCGNLIWLHIRCFKGPGPEVALALAACQLQTLHFLSSHSCSPEGVCVAHWSVDHTSRLPLRIYDASCERDCVANRPLGRKLSSQDASTMSDLIVSPPVESEAVSSRLWPGFTPQNMAAITVVLNSTPDRWIREQPVNGNGCNIVLDWDELTATAPP